MLNNFKPRLSDLNRTIETIRLKIEIIMEGKIGYPKKCVLKAKWKAIFLSLKCDNFFPLYSSSYTFNRYVKHSVHAREKKTLRVRRIMYSMTGNWTHFQFEVLMNELFTWKRPTNWNWREFTDYPFPRTMMWRRCC